MAIDIVKEIIVAGKSAIGALLPDYTQLDYEYDLLKNSDRANPNGFGFIPLDADFVEGKSLGFSTMAQRFQIILTNDYSNYSTDAELGLAIQGLYGDMHSLAQDFMAKKLALPTASYKVLLVRGLTFQEPEIFEENKLVALRATIEIQYRFINNC